MVFVMYICKLCNREFTKRAGLMSHCVQGHKLTKQEAYDIHFKLGIEGKCLVCGKPTLFESKKYRYHKYCCAECRSIGTMQSRINNCQKNYGTDYYFQTEEFDIKRKITNLIRYGTEFAQQSKGVQEKLSNSLRSDHAQQAKKATNLAKWGVEQVLSNREVQLRRQATLRKNNSIKLTTSELNFYNKLCTYFDIKDICINYSDEYKYPYMCDFYIKSLDLFIECNFHWSHGKHPFNKNSKEDLETLAKWKAKNTKAYNNAIKTWTIRDINKQNCAKQNGLNYIMLYSNQDVTNFFNRM